MDNTEYDPSSQDPFSYQISRHHSIRESHELGSDVYHLLFDFFFEHDEYKAWLLGKTSRQLYCTGGPGSGKTTLIALAGERIRNINSTSSCEIASCFQNKQVHVASVFIEDEVVEDSMLFLEDFLCSIYRQLSCGVTSRDDSSSEMYDRYLMAQEEGSRVATRIHNISEALLTRIHKVQDLGQGFLLVDGIDRCCPSLQELMEREMSVLHDIGLRIMIASRLAPYEKPQDISCDVQGPNCLGRPVGRSLKLYWKCTICYRWDVCSSCKAEVVGCENCKVNTHLKEPRFLLLNIDKVYEQHMKKFVEWDLEREHGDLGLGSTNSNKPPLSALGSSLQRMATGFTAGYLVTRITEEARGNVGIAKLGLDAIHQSSDNTRFKSSVNRLPRNVTAFFDEAVKSLQLQHSMRSNFALKAIATVGKCGDTSGVLLQGFSSLLRERSPNTSATASMIRSTEDLLHATKGLLQLKISPREGKVLLAAYHDLFYLYAAEDYNEDITWAFAPLLTLTISRSLTNLPENRSNYFLGQLYEDAIGDSSRAELLHSEHGSPLSRDSPIGLSRRSTF